MSAKKTKTKQVHWLLLLLGLSLITGGIIWGVTTDGNKEYYIILTTVGGTLFGLSLSWLIEEHYKKVDNREESLDLFQKAISIYENSLKPEKYPTEKSLEKFRKQPIHIYYSTQSEIGKTFWNYAIIDYAINDDSIFGRLQSDVSIANYKGKVTEYESELFHSSPVDNILLLLRRKGTSDAQVVCVFDNYKSGNVKPLHGFVYHDDWNDIWRLSPAILAFSPIFERKTIGCMSTRQSLQLQKEWNKHFKDVRPVFEDYTQEHVL